MQNLLYERSGITLGINTEGKCDHPKEKRTTIPAKGPTCTEPGWDAYELCECGIEYPFAKNVLPATDHKWNAATCTTAKTCNVCNATEDAALGHTYAGSTTIDKCGRCSDPNPNYSPTVELKPGSNTGRNQNAETTEATEATEGDEIVLVGEGEQASEGAEGGDAGITIGGGEETIETYAVTEAPDPVTEPKNGPCNPFSCGCWIYILLALVIGIVGGWFLNEVLQKQKKSKRRSRPYTKVEYAPAPVTSTTTAQAAVSVPAAPPVVAAPAVVGSGVAAAVHQHIGARKDQQDSYGVSDLNAYGSNGVLAVVADGMGGLANGAAVSSTLVHSLLAYFRQTTGKESTADMMLDMVTQANDQINRMLQGAERSGSTLVSAIIRDGRLHFLTVGDSRIYLYRKGALLQLNREHIYQEELALKAVNHIVPLQQVTGDRQAHALTSFLGIGRLTHIDRNYESIKLEAGDRLLLASDGVFGTLSEKDMETALRNNLNQAAELIGQKILKANLPYQDNNTALVLEYRG